ncbi:MAG: aminotransferase class I/II-fold pyridoxal phosphate-dependent enzyme [Phaeodactylibacter sp.]|nr:aminotransferase class I/II-fold pyridoxal phosphate-dependent enzyme [Phaeodactylibacter sp.]
MEVNLISDTITRPTPAMLEAMFQAEVGDDVFREDPTVNRLEEKAAAMFGKDAALFCPSGTMTNQIAINVNTQPLDEVICDHYSHIYLYETAGYAFHSGVGLQLIQGTHGKIRPDQIEAVIKPDFDWLPKSSLVVLENTSNKGGGSIYKLEEIQAIRRLCLDKGLRLHLDGARLFNALVETGDSTLDLGGEFDSISICLSKGLGAPVGSLLLGSVDFIRQARRVRKVMGGGMRQAGFLAAAGIYALDHHVERLKIDNDRARKIGSVLETLDAVQGVRPVQSNIILFDLQPPLTAQQYLDRLALKEIKASPFGAQTIRFVTHLDLTDAMIDYLLETLPKV